MCHPLMCHPFFLSHPVFAKNGKNFTEMLVKICTFTNRKEGWQNLKRQMLTKLDASAFFKEIPAQKHQFGTFSACFLKKSSDFVESLKLRVYYRFWPLLGYQFNDFWSNYII